MVTYLGVYFAVFSIFSVVDLLWLQVIAVSWYQAGMGPLLADSPNLWAAAAFYLLFPLGLLIFAVEVHEKGNASVLKVAVRGALFGFFAYATYDLTSLAVIKNWPLGLSLVDMAWGSLLSGLALAAGKITLNYSNRQR